MCTAPVQYPIYRATCGGWVGTTTETIVSQPLRTPHAKQTRMREEPKTDHPDGHVTGKPFPRNGRMGKPEIPHPPNPGDPNQRERSDTPRSESITCVWPMAQRWNVGRPTCSTIGLRCVPVSYLNSKHDVHGPNRTATARHPREGGKARAAGRENKEP